MYNPNVPGNAKTMEQWDFKIDKLDNYEVHHTQTAAAFDWQVFFLPFSDTTKSKLLIHTCNL